MTKLVKIGITCCSNGVEKERAGEVGRLEETLRGIGAEPVRSPYLYADESGFGGTGEERAQALMEFYRDDTIAGIFDISGGDIANGVLPYLDYGVIADSDKLFWGYSDLTTVINAIYAKTGKASVLYQIRNLLYDHAERQIRDFQSTFLGDSGDLFRIAYRYLTSGYSAGGKEMQGIVVGGNVRCFLKLAGTEYMPDLQDKILLLESYGGVSARMETYLCQLEQLGAFRKAAGILLGTFTEMEREGCVPAMETLVRKFAGKDFPIAVTRDIGHGTDAKGILIGRAFGSIVL